MSDECHNAMKILLWDAGFETEKTAASFDRSSLSVKVYFKDGKGRPVYRETFRGDGWSIAAHLKKNGLLAAEILNEGHYSVYATHVQIYLPLSFVFNHRGDRIQRRAWTIRR